MRTWWYRFGSGLGAMLVVVTLLSASVLAGPVNAPGPLVPQVGTGDASGLPDFPTAPGLPLLEDCEGDSECWAAAWHTWTEEAPLEALEPGMVDQLEAMLGAPVDLPTPPQIEGYAALSESQMREAWRAWFLAGILETRLGQSASGLPGSLGSMEMAQPAGVDGHASTPSAQSVGDARGLSGVWRLEGHGYPQRVIPAGPDGATFLVTSQGVLSFPAPGEDPEWMVRPVDHLGRVEATEAGSSGYRDLVLGVQPAFQSQRASLLVVDGATGEVTFRGFFGDERLLIWTLTDLDGQGTMGIIGLDASGNVVTADLEGDVKMREPMPGLPSESITAPGVPVFVALLFLRVGTGPFADLNGDGSKDLFISGLYYAFACAVVACQSQQIGVLSAFSGRDMELLWHNVAGPGFAYPLAAGDLTGNGAEDLVVYRFGSSFLGALLVLVLVSSFEMEAVSGEDGSPLSREGSRTACVIAVLVVQCLPDPLAQFPQFPEAIADLGGDGQNSLVHAEAWWDYGESPPSLQSLSLVTRQVGMVPGGPFDEQRHELSYPSDAQVVGSRFVVQKSGNAQEVLLLVRFVSEQDEGDGAVETRLYRLDGDGVEEVSLDRLYGHLQRDDADGSWYGWMMGEDRWYVLDDDLEPQGDGMRLVVSVWARLEHDRDGDRVPDLLVQRSIGYSWVSGKNGAMVEEFDRPPTRTLFAVLEQHGEPVLLERDQTTWEFHLVDLQGQELAHVGQDLLEERNFRGLVDVTGDGRLDLWLQDHGEWGDDWNWTPGDHVFLSIDEEETLHEVEGVSGLNVYVGDYLRGRPGSEILVRVSDDGLEFELQVAGESGSRWSFEYAGAMRSIDEQVLVLAPDSEYEGLELEFYDTESGTLAGSDSIPKPHEEAYVYLGGWGSSVRVHDVQQNGGRDAVYVYNIEDSVAEKVEQHVRIVSFSGNKTSSFPLSDPPVIQEGWAWWLVLEGSLAGFVGDWDGNGTADAVFLEQGRAVVRSLSTGEVLAVGPRGAVPAHTIDLNRDGVSELGLRQGERLRFFVYDQLATAGLEGDDERLANPAVAQREEEGAKRVFPEESPLSGVALLVVFSLLGLVWVARRRS